jgi:hypothetical protein
VKVHGAYFDLIVGAWGEGTSAAERAALTLAFRQTDEGPAFMVIDAGDRAHARSELVGRALDRNEVLNGPFAAHAFAIVDAIWLQDDRIQELREPAA